MKRIAGRLACALPLLVGSALARSGAAQEASPTLQDLRRELAEIHVLRDYRVGKNSFILGMEKNSGLPNAVRPGQRKTLLHLEGEGSLRHLWETHRRKPDATGTAFFLEFFVDGEATPSLRGDLENLIAAAQRLEQPFLCVPASVVDHRSQNLYLPIPFRKSLRVDFVCDEELDFIFSQWDYRLDDDSLRGVKLAQRGEGQALQLEYQGRLEPRSHPPQPDRKGFQHSFTGDGGLRLEGPAVLRRLAVNARRSGVALRIRFDDATTSAVDADLSDFFGPFRGAAFNNNACYLPMPFRKSAWIELVGSLPSDEWRIEAELEPVETFSERWGYFHARSSRASNTTGHLPFPVLRTRGRGHWLGMSLYNSGHDHGGGDYVVLDADSERPGFLKGINGEDYFSFAWFGRGQNLPYSEAFDNVTGRQRLHLENPHPFREGIMIDWQVLERSSPRAVAYWYQDSPEDESLGEAECAGLLWQVFGPVDAATRDDANVPDTSSPERLFVNLPDPTRLEAGDEIPVQQFNRRPQRGVYKGWSEQRAVGPYLNLTYIYRHVMDLGGDGYLPSYPRAMMAQTRLHSDEARRAVLQVSYDDPIQMLLNAKPVLEDMALREGFTTRRVPVELVAGENLLLVRLADTAGFNNHYAALSLRVLDE